MRVFVQVILVGHNVGGYNVTYTMERFPHKIFAAIFVSAIMALSGTTLFDSLNEISFQYSAFKT